MVIGTIACLLDDLRRLRLLESKQLDELVAQQRKFRDAQALVHELVRRGWVTPFQANLLLQGRGADLAQGSYLVLERLGQGATGQVFKALHRGMNRLVALKVVRKELAADAETVGRFYREMEATSKLEHSNLVHAYDAGPLGATHFLAMEFVDGTDLDQLVRKSGPLPVAQACDFIRQAALGLQDIHQHGLVHRDIKPSNLMVVQSTGPQAQSLVKILDLGLARFQESVYGKKTTKLPDGKSLTTLTLDGTVTAGTIDYLSPEQALDFHQVDIRGDIYSLGCTLFFALTGRPPFGDGPLAVKLMRHQQAEPPALERFRQDVPPMLATVLQRMLAKRPPDRYQTPAEVAAALAPFGPSSAVSSPASHRRRGAHQRIVAGILLASLVLAGIITTVIRLDATTPSPAGPRAHHMPETPSQAVQPILDFAAGFGRVRGLQLNGSARIPLDAPVLRLTDGQRNQAGSAFSQRKVTISRFCTQFDFRLSNAQGDGFAFVIQGVRAEALGGHGGTLGYGQEGNGLGQSIALKFVLCGEGDNSISLFVNALPAGKGGFGSFDASNALGATSINLHNGHCFTVRVNYDGTTLAVSITDKSMGANARLSCRLDIPAIVGGNSAHVGFTGGTGKKVATQDVLAWTFTPAQ